MKEKTQLAGLVNSIVIFLAGGLFNFEPPRVPEWPAAVLLLCVEFWLVSVSHRSFAYCQLISLSTYGRVLRHRPR